MNRQYIVSERAHLMCPNMNFGFMVKINAVYQENRMKSVLEKLSDAHPFLKCTIAKEKNTGKYYYDYHNDRELAYQVGLDAKQWEKDYIAHTQNGWNVMKENLLKVIVYLAEQNFEVLFMAHHLLVDGRGMLGLANEFANCYVSNQNPKYAEEQILTSIDELPVGSKLSWVSKLVINNANRNWKKEHHVVNYEEYCHFEKDFIKENPIHFIEENVQKDQVKLLLEQCRKESVSLNDYLVADMMQKEHCDKVIIAADIRKQITCYHEGALGNYATAMSIVTKIRTDDIWIKAKAVAKQVKQCLGDVKKSMLILTCYFVMEPELLDAVAISTLGDYESKTGKFVGTVMFGYEKREGFSVTNLGSVENDNIVDAMFIPPASPANRKTMGVVSVNGLMKKCTVIY